MNKKQKIVTASILGATVLMSTSCMLNAGKDDVVTDKTEIAVQEQVKNPTIKEEESNHKDSTVVQEDLTEDIQTNTTTNESKDKTEVTAGNIDTAKPDAKPSNNNNVVVKPSTSTSGNTTSKPNNNNTNTNKPDSNVEVEDNNATTKPPASNENVNNDNVSKPEVETETETNPDTPSNPDSDDNTPDHPTVEDDTDTDNDNMGTDPEAPSLVVNDDSLTNGELVVANDTFKDVHIDVSSDTKVVLDNVEIEGKLTLQNGEAYAVEVKDSSVKNIELQDSATTLARSSVDTEITLTLTNVKDLQAIDVNGDININGNIEIPNLNIAGGIVIVDLLANSITINEEAKDVELTLNEDTNKIYNNGTSSIIKVNSDSSTITSNGTDSSIYIKEGVSVTNAVLSGESERIMGNGTLENATVNGTNVGILTNINQNNITVNDSASNVTIGREETIKIESIKLGRQGSMSFTLNEATEKPLTIDDVSIICHGGKSMTVVNITTKDNKTYELSTAYYKDNTYELYVTLPNNKVISKEFVYSYNHPTASKVEANRVSDTDLTLDIYDVDEGGYLYHILVEKTVRNSITPDYIKENGVKTNLVVGYNEIKISNLESDKEYELHYVMEAFDGRTSPVYSGVSIGKYEAPSQEEYAVESIEEVEMNKIVFKFNRPVETLTVDDIEMLCPLGTTLTTTNATLTPSDGGKTWTMVIPENYQHADNKYTATIKMPDGNYIQGTFVAHFNYPVINGETLTRPSENKLKFEFNSDERGTVYYGVYEWNGEYNSNSNNPKAVDVLNGNVEGTKQVELVAGANSLEVDLAEVTNDTRIWVLYVDYAGNYRTGFTDYHKVPAYVPPVVEEEPETPETPEVETTLEITKVDIYEGWTGTSVELSFNESLGSSITKNDVTLESITGMTLPSVINMDIWQEPSYTAIEFTNAILTAGDYKITIQVVDSKGNLVKVSKVFTVN